jgi:hypothetical protein
MVNCIDVFTKNELWCEIMKKNTFAPTGITTISSITKKLQYLLND